MKNICWLVGHWWQRTEYGDGIRECARCLLIRDVGDKYTPQAVRDGTMSRKDVRALEARSAAMHDPKAGQPDTLDVR